MTEFQRKPLGLLDRVYRFVGGEKAANSIPLERDIQLVHDVSRGAERSGLGPYFGYVDWVYEIVSAAYFDYAVQRTAMWNMLGVTDEEYELWILGASAWVPNGDESQVNYFNVGHGVDTSKDRKVIGWPDLAEPTRAVIWSIAGAVGGGDFKVICDENAGVNVYWAAHLDLNRPVRVEPNGYVAVVLSPSAAVNLRFTVNLWAGAFGTTPPGMA